MQNKTIFQPDLVLVRRAAKKSRDDFAEVVSEISNPFDKYDEGQATDFDGVIGSPETRLACPLEWAVLVELCDSTWCPLFSNTLGGADLFRLTSESEYTEGIRLCCEKKLSFEFVRARGYLISFSGDSGGKSWALECFEMEELEEQAAACETADQVFDLLCEHFDVNLPFPTVVDENSDFSFVDFEGKRLKNGMKGFVLYERDNGAVTAEMLQNAIRKSGRPEVVAAAIKAGGLKQLEDPLGEAIFQVRRFPTWRANAELLVAAGCDVNATSGKFAIPVVVNACSELLSEEQSIAAIQFLIDHGVDLSQPDKRGITALSTSVFHFRANVVRFLIQNGADPFQIVDGKSIIDRLREFPDPSTGELDEENEKMIQLLESIEPGEIPADTKTETSEVASAESNESSGCEANADKQQNATPDNSGSKELSIESELTRFKQVQEALKTAERLLTPRIERIRRSPLSDIEDCRIRRAELKALGFEFAGYISSTGVPVAGMTDPLRKFDAVIIDGFASGDSLLRVHIIAHHPDGTASCVGNLASPATKGAGVSMTRFAAVPSGSPNELVAELSRMTEGKELVSVAASDFVKRFTDLSVREVQSARNSLATYIADNSLQTESGLKPRFERVGIYLKTWNVEKETHEYTSKSVAEECLNTLQEPMPKLTSFESNARRLVTAAKLSVLRHLQFVGVPVDNTFADIGIQAGLDLFKALKEDPKLAKENHFWGVPELTFLWTLLAVEGRFEDVRQVAANLRATFAPDSMWGWKRVEPKYLTLLLRIVAKEYSQDESRRKPSKTVRGNLRRSECEMSNNLLAVWDAILEQDQELFESTLRKSMEFTIPRNRPLGSLIDARSGWWDPFADACWVESFLLLLGIDMGLEKPESSPELHDWLLVPGSHGHDQGRQAT